MRIIIALTLTLIYLLIGYTSYKKTKDVFSPLTFFSFYQFIRYVPNILIKSVEHNFIITNESLLLLFVYQIIFICSVLIGYKIIIRFKNQNSVKRMDSYLNLPLVFVLFLIGIISRGIIIQQSGGLINIINSPGSAYLGLSSGTGYLSLLSNLSVFSIVIYAYKYKLNRIIIFLLVSMIILYIFSYAIYSSRSPILELFLILFFIYNYLIKRIQVKHFFRIKYFAIGFIMLYILMALPYFRSGDVTNLFDYNTVFLIFENGFKSFFDQFSYVGRDAFVFSHFNVSNRWYGQPFINLFYGPIPSSFFQNKPALDDGIYLNHLLHGFYITPDAGRLNFQVLFSVPFSSQSSMFANFGAIGVVLGGLFLGFLYNLTYNKMLRFKTPLTVFIYYLIIYQLELSSLSIVQTLIPLVTFYCCYYIVKKIHITSKGRL